MGLWSEPWGFQGEIIMFRFSPWLALLAITSTANAQGIELGKVNCDQWMKTQGAWTTVGTAVIDKLKFRDLTVSPGTIVLWEADLFTLIDTACAGGRPAK
jgi:hypothetical protein